MKKKSYHHGDLRNTLIRAGLALLSEEGVNALSLRKVAKEADVSYTALYRHFANKEALIVAIAEEGFHELAKQLKIALDHLTTHEDISFTELEEMSLIYLRFAQENSHHLRVMFGGAVDKHAYPALLLASEKTFGLLVQIVEIMQEKGVLRPADANAVALGFWSMLHGIAILLIENKIPPAVLEKYTETQIFQSCVQTLYDGIGEKGK